MSHAPESRSATAAPCVSILVVCRNEEEFLRGCVESLLDGTYPLEKLELLIIEGDSDDRTLSVAHDLAKRYACIRVWRNERRITPVGLNLGVRAARHDIIMWVGAHATYERGYVRACVDALLTSDAWSTGGILRTVPREHTLVSDAIVTVLSSGFGVGNARFRTAPTRSAWVDTVFGGCFRRFVFERVGMFNERLARGQDMEFSIRLHRAGGRILLTPDAVCTYFARTGLRDFVRHTYINGVWAILPFAYSNIVPVRWRHLVPLAFVAGTVLLALGAAAGISWAGTLLLAEAVVYATAAVGASLAAAMRSRRPLFVLFLPFVFLLLHGAYGIGSLVGCVKALAARGTQPAVSTAAPNGPPASA